MATFEMSGEAPKNDIIGPEANQLALVANHEGSLIRLKELNSAIDNLEDIKAKVEADLISAFKKLRCLSVKTEYGRFTLISGTRHKYGDDIKEMEEEVKLAKEACDKRGEYTEVKSRPFIKVSK